MVKHSGKRGKSPSLTTLIVAALGFGIAWGLFFGEAGTWVKWIGDVYVGLLQMTVLPYVALSLIACIGRLSVGQSAKLVRATIRVMLLLWGIGLTALAIMTVAIPSRSAGSFFSAHLLQEPAAPNWLQLFIPSNPFWSLANNVVPAVVLFSLALGIGLMRVPRKELLLDQIDLLVQGLGHMNRMIVRLAPIGIFGIVGYTAGTFSLEQLDLVQGYVWSYGAIAVLLSLWVLPAFISCCTPFSQREILRACRDPLIAAVAIGNTFIVLPMLIDAVHGLLRQHQLDREDSGRLPAYSIQLAYPFPDMGRIVGLLFIPFAAYFYGIQIDAAAYPQLIGAGFFGSFAKSIVTIPFLLDLAHIPSDIFRLYLAIGVVTGRFGDLMKVMHLAAFAILVGCFLANGLHWNLRRLISRGLITVALLTIVAGASRNLLVTSFNSDQDAQHPISDRQLLGSPAGAVVLDQSEPNPMQIGQNEDPLDRIRRRRIIRIGVTAHSLPFSYFNRHNELVGFDIDMAHQLAHDLNVRIEFVPLQNDVAQSLDDDHFDIAMSGLNGTIRRAIELPAMQPYMEVTRALVVPDYRRSAYHSLEQLEETLQSRRLRIAVISGSVGAETRSMDSTLGTGWGELVRGGLAQKLDVIELADGREFFESRPPVADALATSAEEGSAWTLEYPGFSVVKPVDLNVEIPLYYFVAKRSQLADFLNSWLKLKRRDGTIKQLYDYWILGEDQAAKTPRWSVLRNVLHWNQE